MMGTESEVREKGIDRRSFLTGAGGALLTLGALGGLAPRAHAAPAMPTGRALRARQMRIDMAELSYSHGAALQRNNGEEAAYPNGTASFCKGLPHDSQGRVSPGHYQALRNALEAGTLSALEAVPRGGPRKWVNPLAGHAMDLEGRDGASFAMPPVPLMGSERRAAEYAELCWMALMRDVPFEQFGSHPLARSASADFSAMRGYGGPGGRRVTPAQLFRGTCRGDLDGPFLAQYLLQPVPYGPTTIDPRIRTTVARRDYGTSWSSYLAMQNGAPTPADAFDPTPRYMRNMRDLGQYVHVDALYQAYLNAALQLLAWNAPWDPGHPYADAQAQHGFGTFGSPHLLSLVTEVATRALKAVWHQKWLVHRNQRPEEFGGRLFQHMAGNARYPIHDDLLRCEGLAQLVRRQGNPLLPLAFPEGSPMHPSYGAGHATVAGACVTILKAWFDESWVLPNPVVADVNGTRLLPYRGAPLTVGGELNKLVANISLGRSMAGVHWRCDYTDSIRLGEAVALSILEEQRASYAEQARFTLTNFDGVRIEA